MTISDTIEQRGLWSRIKPLLPYFVTAALFAGGAWALYHLLKPVNFHDVMA